MITSLLINFFFYVLNLFVGLLPAVTSLPSAIGSSLTTLFGYLNTFSFIIPISTITTILALTFAFESALLIYKFVMWLIHLFRPHTHNLTKNG